MFRMLASMECINGHDAVVQGMFSGALLVLLALTRAHPGQIMVFDDGAALAAGQDDGSVHDVGQHGAAEALELEGQLVELLLADVVGPALAVGQLLPQVYLCSSSGQAQAYCKYACWQFGISATCDDAVLNYRMSLLPELPAVACLLALGSVLQ